MRSKKSLIVASLSVIGAGLFVFTTAGSKEQPGNKLEGAWICKAPLPAPFPTAQWTVTFAPTDPAGRAAVVSGSLQVAFSAVLCPATGQGTPPAFDGTISRDFIGEAVMTGPQTARITLIGYELAQADQVVFIYMGTGEMTFTASGKATGTSTLAYYMPETDTNGDGIPEGAPFCVLPGQYEATRVGVTALPGLPQ